MTRMWQNGSEAVQCVNTERPLTHSLDLSEEGLAMQATRTCSVANCDSPHKAKSFCKLHYQRFYRTGDAASRPASEPRTCSLEGCDMPHQGRGYCRTHWSRFYVHGDPTTVLPNPAMLPGSLNSKWLGDKVTYRTAHERVRKARGLANQHACVDCGKQADEWSYDRSDPDERVDASHGHPYSTKIAHYEPRCRPCHWIVDRPDAAAKRSAR